MGLGAEIGLERKKDRIIRSRSFEPGTEFRMIREEEVTSERRWDHFVFFSFLFSFRVFWGFFFVSFLVSRSFPMTTHLSG
jgi:hypothetical protein